VGALEYIDYYRWEGDGELIYYPYAMSSFVLPSHKKISGKILRQLDDKDSFMYDLECPINIEFGKIFK